MAGEELRCEVVGVVDVVRPEAGVDLPLVAVVEEVVAGSREVGAEVSHPEDVEVPLEEVDSGEDEAKLRFYVGTLNPAFGSCV